MAAHVLVYSLFYPALANAWSSLLGFGLGMLGLPARVWRDPALAGNPYFSWIGVDMPVAAFTPLQGLAHAVLIAALVTLSRWFKPHLMPLAYALRLLCGFHAVVIFYFLYSPIPFPYSVLQHTLNLFSFGAVMILLIPAILALTYYPLETSWARRTAGTLLIMLRDPWGVPLQLCQRTQPFPMP